MNDILFEPEGFVLIAQDKRGLASVALSLEPHKFLVPDRSVHLIINHHERSSIERGFTFLSREYGGSKQPWVKC